jgi:hypothetical protein
MNTTYTVNRLLWYAHLLIVCLGCSADKLNLLHGFTPLGLTSASNHRSVILLQKRLPVVIWILNEILSIYYPLEYILLRRFLGMRNEVSGTPPEDIQMAIYEPMDGSP